MKVYVLTLTTSTYGHQLKGVYSTLERAQAKAGLQDHDLHWQLEDAPDLDESQLDCWIAYVNKVSYWRIDEYLVDDIDNALFISST